MNNQQNNNLGMVFGSHLGLGAVAAPYTQKALEERLKMIADMQAFLSLVFSMAPAILEKMQTVEKTFYTQASDMIRQQASGLMAAGISQGAMALGGLGAAGYGLKAGGSLSMEGSITQGFSDKLSRPYEPVKIEVTSTSETTTSSLKESTEQDASFKGLEAKGKLEQIPTFKPVRKTAKKAANSLLSKTEVDQTSAKSRTGLQSMGKDARTQEFETLDSNTSGKEKKTLELREAYSQKFAAKAQIMNEQGKQIVDRATSISQNLGNIGSAIGSGLQGYYKEKEADAQLEQADTAAAKVANDTINQQFSKLSNSSVDELQAFVKSLDAQISVDSQINQQRG